MENFRATFIRKNQSIPGAKYGIKTRLHKPTLKVGMMPNLRLIAVKGKASGDCVHEKFLLLRRLICLHFKQHNCLTLFLQFSTINCSSSKHLYNTIKLLNAYQRDNKRILIHWDCEASNTEMLDTALDFREFCECEFNINLK